MGYRQTNSDLNTNLKNLQWQPFICRRTNPEGLQVFLGHSRRLSYSSPGVHRNVKEITTHPNYDYQNYNIHADIAIIKLDSPVGNTRNIRPLCLSNATMKEAAFTGHQPCVVAGWGKRDDFGEWLNITDESRSYRFAAPSYLSLSKTNLLGTAVHTDRSWLQPSITFEEVARCALGWLLWETVSICFHNGHPHVCQCHW